MQPWWDVSVRRHLLPSDWYRPLHGFSGDSARLLLVVLGAGISSSLPAWLGGDVSIRRDASIYFFIFSIFLPVLQMIFLAGGMLRCSGNMRIPSLLGVIMCVLDVVFNFFLIFPTCGCGHHSCRSEHRSRTEETDP